MYLVLHSKLSVIPDNDHINVHVHVYTHIIHISTCVHVLSTT